MDIGASVCLDSVANAVVVVAHPDDETLWAGGVILGNPHVRWHVISVTRASDADRAPRYRAALAALGATGDIADLDDGPDQRPMPPRLLELTIATMLPTTRIDLLLTHGPEGEYTRHRRHEEVCRAVVSLWQEGLARANSLWLFAYGDSGAGTVPRPKAAADLRYQLTAGQWAQKTRIITDVYGFAADSWEARSVSRVEAFWRFPSADAARAFVYAPGVRR